MKIPVALTMYTVRDEAAKDYLAAVRKTAEIGYEAIQTHYNATDPAALKDECARLGISICGIHVGLAPLIDELESVIAFTQALGCRDVTCAGVSDEYKNYQGYIEAGKKLGEAAAILADRGLRLTYHNHAFEFEPCEGSTGHELIFSNAGGGLQAELDTYWVQHAGLDPISKIREFSGRLPLLHIKDMEAGDEKFFAEVGEGILDWQGIFAAAQDAGVEWMIVEQDSCRRDPFESARISLGNIKRFGD